MLYGLYTDKHSGLGLFPIDRGETGLVYIAESAIGQILPDLCGFSLVSK